MPEEDGRPLGLWPGPCTQVGLGALVHLADDDGAHLVLVLPDGAGTTVQVDGQPVAVVTERAPVLRALWGGGPGDAEEVPRGRRIVEVTVEAVA